MRWIEFREREDYQERVICATAIYSPLKIIISAMHLYTRVERGREKAYINKRIARYQKSFVLIRILICIRKSDDINWKTLSSHWFFFSLLFQLILCCSLSGHRCVIGQELNVFRFVLSCLFSLTLLLLLLLPRPTFAHGPSAFRKCYFHVKLK